MKCAAERKLSRHVINYQFIKSIDYRLLNSLRAEAAVYGGFYCNNIQFDSAVKVYNKNEYLMFVRNSEDHCPSQSNEYP